LKMMIILFPFWLLHLAIVIARRHEVNLGRACLLRRQLLNLLRDPHQLLVPSHSWMRLSILNQSSNQSTASKSSNNLPACRWSLNQAPLLLSHSLVRLDQLFSIHLHSRMEWHSPLHSPSNLSPLPSIFLQAPLQQCSLKLSHKYRIHSSCKHHHRDRLYNHSSSQIQRSTTCSEAISSLYKINK